MQLTISPTQQECETLLASYNVVPVYTIIEDYTVTPLQVFEYFKLSANNAFLESLKVHSDTGRYSIMGMDFSMGFSAFGNKVIIVENDKERRMEGKPIAILKEILKSKKSFKNSKLPEFTGGAIGFFKYEALRYFESLTVDLHHSDVDLPEICFNFYDTVICFDHVLSKLFIISNVSDDVDFLEAVARIEDVVDQLAKIPPSFDEVCLKDYRGVTDKDSLAKQMASYPSSFNLEMFKRGVERVKEYICAGDIFQANISQRIELDCQGMDSFLLYKVLRKVNPSPFACFLDVSTGKNTFQIVSSSPERLVKLSGSNVSTRPIAGTRPKLKEEAFNDAQVEELFTSPKEKAEHLMLVDLERNDLGRVCDYGTVRVSDFMVMEDYSHVHHIVSNVEGILRKDKDNLDLIAAVFPGGTITGAPKVRCMEIINEIEPVSRDIYTGSIGYIGYNGDIDFNIVIRSFFVYKGKGWFHVGAGIVADSDAEKEYFETLYKGEALLRAWEIVKGTLGQEN